MLNIQENDDKFYFEFFVELLYFNWQVNQIKYSHIKVELYFIKKKKTLIKLNSNKNMLSLQIELDIVFYSVHRLNNI